MIRFRSLATALFCSLLCAPPLVANAAAGAPPQSARTSAASSSTVSPSNVWYEIFVRSWYDTNGDGIGDLNGVTAKLDYLKKLGVSGIWLMPISPSPSYHGYDVTDYEAINPQYGSMADFERLLAQAHKCGIKVIIDLVANHSSSQHPWFIQAQKEASPKHDWYTWATPKTDLKAISGTGGSAWHRAPHGGYYLGVFTADMPDLNYDNPAVRKRMIAVGQFWLKKGADGFRLDAAQHIYQDFAGEDESPAVLRKNLAWWSQFRQGMNAVNSHATIIGEVVKDKPQQLAPWFDPLSAVFDFPLAKQLIASAGSERDGALGALLQSTATAYYRVTGKPGMDAPFLSNHDQQRVMSQLSDNPSHMRIAAAMLLTLPGEPFIYYGEELGMRGNKPDPDLREPMRWYRDAQTHGETQWKSFTAGDSPNVSVQTEQDTAGSLLSRYRMLIQWRQQLALLRDGALKVRATDASELIAWQLSDTTGALLVVHNLSDAPQSLQLNAHALQRFRQLIRNTEPVTTLSDGLLKLPPYGSAILRGTVPR